MDNKQINTLWSSIVVEHLEYLLPMDNATDTFKLVLQKPDGGARLDPSCSELEVTIVNDISKYFLIAEQNFLGLGPQLKGNFNFHVSCNIIFALRTRTPKFLF